MISETERHPVPGKDEEEDDRVDHRKDEDRHSTLRLEGLHDVEPVVTHQQFEHRPPRAPQRRETVVDVAVQTLADHSKQIFDRQAGSRMKPQGARA